MTTLVYVPRHPWASLKIALRPLALRNGMWNALAHVMMTSFSIAGSVFIVRSLTPEDFGQLSYFLWLAGVVTLLGTLALPNALTKLTSELRGGGRTEEALALSRLVFVAVLAVNALVSVVLLGAALLRADSFSIYAIVVAAIILPNSLTPVLRSSLWGRQDYLSPSITTTVAAVLQFFLTLTAYLLGWGPIGFFIALLSPNLVQVIGLAIVLRHSDRLFELGKSGIRPSSETLRRYLGIAAPATVLLLLDLMIWQRSGVIFLERMSTLEEVGYYSIAFTAFGMCLMLGWAMVQGFFPAISHSFGAGDKSRTQHHFSQALLVGSLYAAPLCFGGIATVGGVFDALYGSKMSPAIPATQILLTGLIPGVLAGVVGLTMNGLGRLWGLVRFSLSAAIVNVLVNIILVGRLGASGGAIANTVSISVVAVLLLGVATRLAHLDVPLRDVLGIVVVGFLTTFVIPAASQQYVPGLIGVLLGISLGGALYALGIWQMGYLKTFSTIGRAI